MVTLKDVWHKASFMILKKTRLMEIAVQRHRRYYERLKIYTVNITFEKSKILASAELLFGKTVCQRRWFYFARKPLKGGLTTTDTDKTQSVYKSEIKTTLLLLTCSITSCHSESESAQMQTTMSQSCYCLWRKKKKTTRKLLSSTMSVLYISLPQDGSKVLGY